LSVRPSPPALPSTPLPAHRFPISLPLPAVCRASLPKSPTLHHFPSARLKAPPGACGLRTRPALVHAEAEKNPPTTSPARGVRTYFTWPPRIRSRSRYCPSGPSLGMCGMSDRTGPLILRGLQI
jgi:hypothetical protein